MTRSVLLVALLAACAPKAPPPSIYPIEPPPMDPPDVAEVEPAADEVPAVAPYVPGAPPPYVNPESCLVEGRGLVLPESKAVELYQAAELGSWWEARALECSAGRAMDRAYCDQVAGRQRQELEVARTDARWLRWAVPLAMTVGIAMGVGAAELADGVDGR